MIAEVLGGLYDGGPPLVAGVYLTLLGHRLVGKRPGDSPEYDHWHERYATTLKVCGPVAVVCGLFMVALGLLRP